MGQCSPFFAYNDIEIRAQGDPWQCFSGTSELANTEHEIDFANRISDCCISRLEKFNLERLGALRSSLAATGFQALERAGESISSLINEMASIR